MRHYLLAITLMTLLFFTISGQAQEATPSQSVVLNIELVLDASGSMGAAIEGQRKIDAARETLNTIIAALPENSSQINIGLRLFGHEGDNSDAMRAMSCESTALFVPIAPINQEAIAAQIQAYRPVGWTPIALALNAAGGDFPQASSASVRNVIILVTDGEETCGGDPCAAAASLGAAGTEIVAHVVGFGLDAGVAETLTCIPENSGGLYFDAADGEALTQTLLTLIAEEAEQAGIALVVTTTPAPSATPGATATPRATGTPRAFTCTVNVADDDVAGLISAIDEANSTADTLDTICLTAESTFTLDTDVGDNNGLPPITSPIQIVGDEARSVVIERASNAAPFRLLSVSPSGDLLLANLVLRNGEAVENGGSILNDRGALALENSTIENSTARYGGGIYSTGTLAIQGSVLSINSATEQGGAIFSAGSTLDITDSVFDANNARYGAGIYSDTGVVTLTDVTLRRSETVENGGVYLRSGTLTLTGGFFELNRARYGGGVYVEGGEATVSETVMQGNAAVEDGAGIYHRGAALTVLNSTFESNTARYGGAIASGGALTVNNSNFSTNSAGENGGAVHYTGSGASVVTGSCFSGNTGRQGGGIFSTTPDFDARNNWWGADDGPAEGGTGIGDAANDAVLFNPFITTGCPNPQ